jgi:alpha-D-xyloside xylohydrolase
MMRSLAFDFQGCQCLWHTRSIYVRSGIFGKPGDRAAYTSGNGAARKAKTRQVYLPAATKWYNFWTGEVTNGGQKLTVDVPMDMMPLYVKARFYHPDGPGNAIRYRKTCR